MKTRDIIEFLNTNFGERISSGSYDDIRRQDLLHLVQAGVVVQTAPEAARNAPNRGYALDPRFAALLRAHGTEGWDATVSAHLGVVGSLSDRLAASRDIKMTPVTIPGGKTVDLTPGEHNDLQRAIIEEFLPRFGRGAELLYLGDASDKALLVERERLRELGFFELDHGELPDVVAYSNKKNWVFLIEAVHSFGPITPIRKIKLENNLKNCKADLVFVTAFQDRTKFRQFLPDLAWEQEIWIAEEPDHMVHFNGDKFLGPYK
jgi:type II restriction enzyme